MLDYFQRRMTYQIKIYFYLIFFSLTFAFPQINFHLTNHFDCLQISAPKKNNENSQEILSLCLTQSLLNTEVNLIDQQFTFDQLRKQNITSEQLYQWSASIDLLEQYQEYLIFNQSSLSTKTFYNCSSSLRFGEQCQYEFFSMPSGNLTLKQMVLEFYETIPHPTSITCYVHLECDRGDLKSFCLDWTDICDGYVDCLNDQIDEKFCWQLQINECHQDEYRCTNGQCISKQFAFINEQTFECLDRSDGYHKSLQINIYPYPPIIYYEDIACPRRHLLDFESTSMTSSCDFTRNNLLSEYITNNKPNSLSEICYFAFACTFYIERLILSICSDICENNKCRLIMNETCPEIIVASPVPLAFGHMYSPRRIPDYVCYDDKLCNYFQSNTAIIYNNKTCYRIEDTSTFWIGSGFQTSLKLQVHSLNNRFRHCNTILYENQSICNSPFLYRCQNSTRCIPIDRICDGNFDCGYHDDEICKLINGSCSPTEPKDLLFKCPLNGICISLSRFGDNICDCELKQHSTATYNDMICEDEPHHICDPDNLHLCGFHAQNSYKAKMISFSAICDGFQDLFPIQINQRNHTDETDCQYWKCNNTYTRCNGYWNCFDGADEVDCDPLPIIKCPLHHHICIQPNTSELICLPLANANDGQIDCLGAIDEPRLCRTETLQKSQQNFYCDSTNRKYCTSVSEICVLDCMDKNTDSFCQITNKTNEYILCPAKNSGGLIEYLCSHLTDDAEERVVTNETLTNSKTTTQCHRGYPLRLSSNRNQIVCLCPPNYYGDYCQYQNQRVSFTLQFQTYSDSRRTLFSIIIQLIDNTTTQRMIHSSKQLTYIYVKHCQTRFNFYLTYSSRPKQSNRTYSIHIDIYEKETFTYRGNLFIPLDFSFLPVHRIAYILTIPRNNQPFPINSISLNCLCVLGSLCIGIEANNRSICICPVNRWGPRCFLSNTICQSNDGRSVCLNDGRCVLTDDSMVSDQKFFCICRKGFSGERCEIEDAKIIIKFNENIIRSETILAHFIEIRANRPHRNGSTFQSIPFYQKEMTIQWSRPFHIAFVELSNKNYYLITVQQDYNRSNIIRKVLTSSDRCSHISEHVNSTIVNCPLIHRIKYYHLPCQQSISCFYDREYFCLCQNFGSERLANCFEFDSLVVHNCFQLSTCQNDGQCIQDDAHCPQTFRCICRDCYYGSLCQFSSSLFDLSLDGIIGSHIQPNVQFTKQLPIIKITTALIILLTTIGFLNSILSFMSFQHKETRQVGCGYYLLGSTITTLLTSIMLALKFSILISAQMALITNKTFLNIQCNSFDYLLQICLNTDRWLNGCIGIERAWNIFKGAYFNKAKSRKLAKYTICFLIIMIILSTIYDPIHRRLVDDEQQRTWCIVSYSSRLNFVNRIIQIFNFFVPFLMNIISSFVIVFLSTKRRRLIKKDESYFHIFSEQVQQHLHLLVSPLFLVILSLPRLIISFVAGCVNSNRNPWVYLIGYLISFIPPMLTFVIFVSPSKLYKAEFRKTVKQYRKRIRRRILRVRPATA